MTDIIKQNELDGNGCIILGLDDVTHIYHLSIYSDRIKIQLDFHNEIEAKVAYRMLFSNVSNTNGTSFI